jgi:small-conductance mechanosensitive channel
VPPAPVVVNSLNNYNLELILRVWLEDETKHVATRFEIRERLYKTLMEANVDMLFEHMTVALAQPAA